jgi:hypothetical protein
VRYGGSCRVPIEVGPKDPVRVLVLGEKPQGLFAFRQLFERNDCQCQFAQSHREVTRLADISEFDIVISTLEISGESVRRLIALLSGSRASLFCSLRVERGYRWLPVLRFGRDCLGTPAFRPFDLYRTFDQLLKEIKPNLTWHQMKIACPATRRVVSFGCSHCLSL